MDGQKGNKLLHIRHVISSLSCK